MRLHVNRVVAQCFSHVITFTRRAAHIEPILKNLHWILIKHKIDFKLVALAYTSSANGEFVSTNHQLHTVPEASLINLTASVLTVHQLVTLLAKQYLTFETINQSTFAVQKYSPNILNLTIFDNNNRRWSHDSSPFILWHFRVISIAFALLNNYTSCLLIKQQKVTYKQTNRYLRSTAILSKYARLTDLDMKACWLQTEKYCHPQ